MTDAGGSAGQRRLVQFGAGSAPARAPRDVAQAMKRGCAGRCPACGQGALFDGYLAVNDRCAACDEAFFHHRADDAPPYFTITLVGHIIVPAVLAVEVALRPAIWIHMALWIPLTILLSLAFLRPIKGGIIGYQWALYMHGFDPDAGDDEPVPVPGAAVIAEDSRRS